MWRVWCVGCVCTCGVVCGVGGVCVLFCCGGACVWCVVKLGTLSLPCSLSFLFRQQIQCCMCRCRCQRRLLPPPLPPLLESVNKAANKVSTKSAFEDVQSAWFVVKTMTVDVFDTLTLSFLLDENILANDFAEVRLETKEGPFYYRNISGEEFIFYYSFKLIPKTRRRGKLQSLQFYINSKTIGL